MKIGRFVCLAVFILFAVNIISSYADVRDESAVITVAISEEMPITVDRVIYRAIKNLGFDIKIGNYGMQDAAMSVSIGGNDVLAVQTDMVSDYKNLVKVPESITTREICVFTRAGNYDAISDWPDFSGKKVGYASLKLHIKAKMPADLGGLTEVKSEEELFQGLMNGDFDYAITSRIKYEELNVPRIVKLAAVLEKQEAYSYVHESNEWLVPLLSEQYSKMKQDGSIDRILLREDAGADSDDDRIRIMHISSYNADMDTEKQLNLGLWDTINKEYYDVFYYSLDAKRYGNEPWRNKSLMQIMRSDFVDSCPNIIIVSGDDAFSFIKQHYYSLFKGVPVVICGVNGFRQEQLEGLKADFAGIAQTISAKETVDFIVKTFPETTELYIVNGYSDTDLIWRDEIARQLGSYGDRLKITFSPNVPMKMLLSELSQLPSTAVVLHGIYFSDSNGKYYLQSESQKLFDEHTKVPSFGLIDTNMGYGQIGGKCISSYNHGKLTADIISRLLNGESVYEMNMIEDSGNLNEWIFDYNEMKRWNIRKSSLPEGSFIVNRKLPIIESNPVAFGLFLTLSIGALLTIITLGIMMRHLAQKNRQLHSAEELLAKDMEIKELNRRSQLIISSAPLGYALIKDGIITEINSFARQRFGLQAGDHIDILLPLGESYKNIMDEIDDLGYSRKVIRLITVNGEQNRFLTSSAVLSSSDGEYLACWTMEIEELERAKDEIRRAQEDFEKVIYTLLVPVVLFDPESFEFIYCNQQFLKLFGFESFEHAKNYTYYDLFPERQPDGELSEDSIRNSLNVMQDSEFYSVDRIYRLLNGNLIYAYISGGGIIYDGRKTVIIMIRDVTAEREQQKMLESIAAKEKESNLLKSRFMINMSHEIRTPLNAIIGFSELALQNPKSDFISFFHKISDSAKILLSIVNDILDFSKIEAKKIDIVSEEFELYDVLSNAMLIAAQRLGDKPVEMLLDIDMDIPCKVVGDKTHLWQILKNFLDNSAKFTHEGRIICKAELLNADTQVLDTDTEALATDEQVLDTDTQNVLIKFTVSDTGVGVSDGNLEKIFIPFEQFGKTAAAKNMGTGLGMSIAKQLIEQMGGNVEISSTEHYGTDIVFAIPFKPVQTPVSFGEFYEQFYKKYLLGPYRALLVDDDPTGRLIMENLLKSAGMEFTAVSSGREAIECVKGAGERGEQFDIIILDYRMDELDGIQTAKQLNSLLENTPMLLMISAHSKQFLDSEIDEVGFKDILEKPFGPNAFYEKIACAFDIDIAAVEPICDKRIQFDGARVLLCEDNYINQEIALGMLEEVGIHAVVADNGRQALDILEQQEFDLILMDILMPEIDGHEVTSYIRNSDKPYKDIVILAMTANAMQEEIKKCFDEGMNDYISKPVDFEKLKKSLSKWLPDMLVK